MKYLLIIIILITPLFGVDETVVLFSGLDKNDAAEFSESYNRKLREVWGADSDVSLVSQDIIDRMVYLNDNNKVSVTPETRNYLKRYGIDSAVVAIPHLRHFSIVPRRKPGFFKSAAAEAYGTLAVRFSFYQLETGDELGTTVVESDTSIFLGVTMVRSVGKSVNISALERDRVLNGLITKNIGESYRHLREILDMNYYAQNDSSMPLSDSTAVLTGK